MASKIVFGPVVDIFFLTILEEYMCQEPNSPISILYPIKYSRIALKAARRERGTV